MSYSCANKNGQKSFLTIKYLPISPHRKGGLVLGGNMEALFLDTYNRMLKIFTVSVTQVGGELVLRFGADVGGLRDFSSYSSNLPVIMTLSGYTAMSSAGFVRLLYWPDNRNEKIVIGICGMPWQRKSKALARCKPMQVKMFPKFSIEKIETHGNSNWSTAAAAQRGIELRANINHNGSVYVIEGQSDWTNAWEIKPHGEKIEAIPEEHRAGMFKKILPAEIN